MIPDLLVHLIFIGYVIGLLLGLGTLLTWVERKQAAVMSDRIGANRAYIRLPFTQLKLVWWGLFHALADGAKMLLKENFTPTTHDRFVYALAPWLVFAPVLLVFAVIPFGGTLDPGRLFEAWPAVAAWFEGQTYQLQIARLDGGLVVIFAFSGLTVIGSLLAGWSSNNKFSLLGAVRAGSQMIAYEVVLALTLLGLVLIHGTVDLVEQVRAQSGMLFGWLPAWGIFLQPFAALLYLTAAMAENKRTPFDLPEAESELIAGFFTEFSAMKMGLFMFAEFIEIAVIGALFVTLFLGGYNLPYMTEVGYPVVEYGVTRFVEFSGFVLPGSVLVPLGHLPLLLLQLGVFLVKLGLVCSFQVLVRWSLPRFRYDQLLRFGWRFLLPLGLLNLAVTAVVLWLKQV